MGDNTEMGTLAVNEELHAKQQEAARKEVEGRALQFPEPSLQEYERVRTTYSGSPPLIPV